MTWVSNTHLKLCIFLMNDTRDPSQRGERASLWAQPELYAHSSWQGSKQRYQIIQAKKYVAKCTHVYFECLQREELDRGILLGGEPVELVLTFVPLDRVERIALQVE